MFWALNDENAHLIEIKSITYTILRSPVPKYGEEGTGLIKHLTTVHSPQNEGLHYWWTFQPTSHCKIIFAIYLNRQTRGKPIVRITVAIFWSATLLRRQSHFSVIKLLTSWDACKDEKSTLEVWFLWLIRLHRRKSKKPARQEYLLFTTNASPIFLLRAKVLLFGDVLKSISE